MGLRGNVDVSCVRRWLALTSEELRSDVFEPPFGGLRGKVGVLSIPRLPISDK